MDRHSQQSGLAEAIKKQWRSFLRWLRFLREAFKFYWHALKLLANFRYADEESSAFDRAREALKISLRLLMSQFEYDEEQKRWIIIPRRGISEKEYVERTLRFMKSASVNGKDLGCYFPLVPIDFELLVCRPRKDAFFYRLEEDFRQAKDHIHIAMYGVWDKHEGEASVPPQESLAARILGLLRKRAEDGIEVRLIFDRFGSRLEGLRIDKEHTSILKTNILDHPQISVVYNESWNLPKPDLERFFKLDHRKIYVIDGRVAYVGGMGIENKFDNSFEDSFAHDVMVRMRGSIVHQFQSAFLDSYCYQLAKDSQGIKPEQMFAANAESLRKRYFPDDVHDVATDKKAQCVMNVPVAQFYGYTEEYVQMLNGSNQCLYITNSAYNDDRLTKLFHQATHRFKRENIFWQKGLASGRGVLLVLPGKKRMKFPDEVIYLTDLINALRNKSTVLRYEDGWLHAKIMMQDNARVAIGSCNLDYFSPHRNWEAGVLLEGEASVKEVMDKVFLLDEPPHSEEISLSQIPLKKRLACKLLDILPWF
jgi:phosphatidylserine/phosphatidylglycerophosphate/cardiolipin synthase-like enzyme